MISPHLTYENRRHFIYSGEIRNEEIFISRNQCNNQCPAGPPGQKGSSGPPGQKGSPGEKGERGDSGVASITKNTKAPTKEELASLYANNVLHPYYIPRFSPVGYSVCKTGTYHFATSFFSQSLTETQAHCKVTDCDIIIEWVRINKSGRTVGYDLGKIDRNQSPCPHNTELPAKVVWKKNPVYKSTDY